MNRAQIHFLKLTNPDTAVRSRWGAGILMPPPTVSGRLPQYSAPTELQLGRVGQNFILYYPAGAQLLLQSALLSLNMMSWLATMSVDFH